jgi:uncharacterized membrane protein YjjB (DUF3815 family)
MPGSGGLLGIIAWKTTALLIQKFNLNPVLTVALALLVGGTISILAIIVSIPLAGIQ